MAHPHLFGLLYGQPNPIPEPQIPSWQPTKWPNPFEERTKDMPTNFGFYNMYSLLSALPFLVPDNDTYDALIMLEIEKHSRNLTPEYREYIFANIASFKLIYNEVQDDYRDKEYLVNKSLKRLISLNLYQKALGNTYALPSKLSSKWDEMYQYLNSIVDGHNKVKYGS